MHLFQCHNAQSDIVPTPTTIGTPLGNIRLEAMVNELKISNELPTHTYRLSSNGWLVCWHQQDFDLELLMRPLTVSFPADMQQVVDCWAGLWRLRSHQPLDSCIFSAVWEDGYTWKDGGPSTGEWLYAKTWDDGLVEVSVGTADEDALGGRSRRGDGMPTEWEAYFSAASRLEGWNWPGVGFWENDIHNEIGNRGIAIPLPALATDQQCQLHFAVAWSAYQEEGVATWLAVDTSDVQILAGSNCR